MACKLTCWNKASLLHNNGLSYTIIHFVSDKKKE